MPQMPNLSNTHNAALNATPATHAPAETQVHPQIALRAQRTWRRFAGWVIVAALLLLQSLLFYQYTQREIVWAYPANYDQVQYLSQSYDTYTQMRALGIFQGLWYGLSLQVSQGAMIHVQASLLFLLLGPSRLSALILNFAYFALFQCVLVLTLHWLTSRWSMALLGLGLLLATSTPFIFAGGMMDFRIDFIAFCLFGVFICVVVRSEVFASWRWSLVAGVVAALLVLFQFATLTYLVGMLVLVGVFLITRLWRWPYDRTRRAAVIWQWKGLLAASTILACVTLPVLWYHNKAVDGAPVVGPIANQGKNTAPQPADTITLLRSLLFYPLSAVHHHAGPFFVGLSLLALGTVTVLVRRRGDAGAAPDVAAPLDTRAITLFIAASLIVPYVTLMQNVSKSEVVGDIFVPGGLWLVMFALVLMCRSLLARRSAGDARIIAGLALVVLAGGVVAQLFYFNRPSQLSQERADIEQVEQLYDTIEQQAERNHMAPPRIATDRVSDYFSADVLRISLYERHGTMFNVIMGMGSKIFAIDAPSALKEIDASNIVLLTIVDAPGPTEYPFDQSMQTIRPKLIARANQTLMPIKDFVLFGRTMRLYVRPGH